MATLDDLLQSEVVQAVIEKISRKVTEQVIEEHIRSCPHGQKLAVGKAYLLGVALGCSLLGGGLGMVLEKLLLGLGS